MAARKRNTGVVKAATADVPTVPGATVQLPGEVRLSQLLGDGYEQVRQAVLDKGFYDDRKSGKRLYMKLADIAGSDDKQVMQLAAVARDPGLTQSYIGTVQDYQPQFPNRTQLLRQYRRIAATEGLISNAINKVAAILSGGGRYKVRYAKKGKARNAVDQLQLILDEFTRNCNNAPLDGVVTGDRGLQMITQQAVRTCLIEGDWFGRTNWINHTIGTEGTFSLPMVIQSIPGDQMAPVKEVDGTGIELFNWQPPSTLVTQLRQPSSKEVKNAITKYVSKDVAKSLINDGKVILDPALLMHIKHRGIGSNVLGESFIEPLKKALMYKNAVESLDLVTMQSLINRITIVMVGSSDPKSPYSKTDVALQRTNLMQSFFDDAGPNMTIIWQGDDVKVESVGAHDQVLSLDTRHTLADGKLKDGMGVADALLRGTTNDGKALAVDTPIPTPTGWTTMGALQPGDQVFDELGRPTNVINVSAVATDHECFEVAFSDGERIVADAEHLWVTVSRQPDERMAIRTTRELADSVRAFVGTGSERNNHRIPIARTLRTAECSLPIPPYALGVWLGDGSSHGARLTCADTEIIEDLAAVGVCATKNTTRLEYALRFEGQPRAGRPRGGFMETLRGLGVIQNKHIPDVYMRAGPLQRLELLQGLMDTDGYISARGQCEFTSVNEALADQVLELLRSLGVKPCLITGTATIGTKKYGTKYRVMFEAPSHIDVFKLPRKTGRQATATHKPVRGNRQRATNRYITAVTPVAPVPVKCIQVDSPSHLFLAGKGMIPTHNSAGWAAILGMSAELVELQTAFGNGWTTIGERIALENNFTDIDVIFEFDNQLMTDRNEERSQNRQDYITGGMSIRDWIAGMGKDPDAVFEQKCLEKGLDPESTTWELAFMPPQGLQGQGAPPVAHPDQLSQPGGGGGGGGGGGTGAPGAPPPGQGPGKAPGKGRPTNTDAGKPTQKKRTPPTPVENK